MGVHTVEIHVKIDVDTSDDPFVAHVVPPPGFCVLYHVLVPVLIHLIQLQRTQGGEKLICKAGCHSFGAVLSKHD